MNKKLTFQYGTATTVITTSDPDFIFDPTGLVSIEDVKEEKPKNNPDVKNHVKLKDFIKPDKNIDVITFKK